MKTLANYMPFARYLLLIVGSFLVQRGILERQVVDQITTDPAVIELVAGLALWVVTLIWYWLSEARSALAGASS